MLDWPPGFNIEQYPKTQAWLQRFPTPQPKKVRGSEAIELIRSSEYATDDIGVNGDDPMRIVKGERVAIEMSDNIGRSGRPPHTGELEGLRTTEVVIQLENGIRRHFPRIGTVIRKV